MIKIDHKTHKLVKLEDLPNVESRCWGEGESIEKFIEYFTYLKNAAEDAGAVKTIIEIGDGYRDIDAWIPKTPEEIENSVTEKRELKELARLKEKYEGQTRA